VTGTIGREAIPVAEFAIGLMIGFFRSIPQTYHRLVTRELTSAEPPPPGDLGWGMEPGDPWLAYRGQDLAGKRLGLVGLGAVGKNVAKWVRARATTEQNTGTKRTGDPAGVQRGQAGASTGRPSACAESRSRLS
jgi:phosphoglycerate dehydrogenase-like enzyme